MPNSLQVLVVEDSVDDSFFIIRELQRGGYIVDFERVETQAAMLGALENHTWDLVICDYSMPRFSGAAALALFRQRSLDVPFIMVSGAMGEEQAVEMLKAGADDIIMKDRLDRLVPAVRRELDAAQERRARKATEAAAGYLASIVRSSADAIIGKTLDGTIVSWNTGAERLYGYSAVEVIGRPVSVLIPPERQPELRQIMERLAGGEGVENLDTVRLRKDGTTVEVSVTISPIRDERGRLIGASTIGRLRPVQPRPDNTPAELMRD